MMSALLMVDADTEEEAAEQLAKLIVAAQRTLTDLRKSIRSEAR